MRSEKSDVLRRQRLAGKCAVNQERCAPLQGFRSGSYTWRDAPARRARSHRGREMPGLLPSKYGPMSILVAV
ncbi:hypothetical protein [Sulfobacillus thermosulfidooxidans]|uniref:hypothetical protein n=1 Tax=Sulfobacillus thermosulfidooxidans TaxID=28034 RepID=UPI001112B9AB|nr:hypothetical protein [Sulfobacillus thermosulfidooxidans]